LTPGPKDLLDNNNSRLTAFLLGQPGRPVPEETVYGAGEDNGGRGTDSLGGRHPKRTNGAPTPTTSPRFFQAGCPSCRPTNSIKALKAKNILLDKGPDSDSVFDTQFALDEMRLVKAVGDSNQNMLLATFSQRAVDVFAVVYRLSHAAIVRQSWPIHWWKSRLCPTNT